jgi:uncharacterized NAD(P)/FAD-binding protein YdhS
MVSTSVAIVGLGSRGLSVLERIVTAAKMAGPAAGHVRVEIVDPSCHGCGVHETSQPDYLLLNTTCSQVSMFPDACTVGPDADAPGPSLYQWATERGLALGEDGCPVSEVGRPIRPTDFLPRRVLGDYLGWFLGQVRCRLPGHVRLVMHRATAVDISSAPDGGLVVEMSDGTTVAVDYAFLTTGYTPNDGAAGSAGHDRLIAEPYPLPARSARVRPGEVVAICGFGLSTMDLMSCLTVGRGGRFTGSGGRFSYRPSGREPVLLFYSRSGVPYRARPLVTKFELTYQPVAFTRANLDALRISRRGPLDFTGDVLPLIFTEMRIAYRRCQARCAGAAQVRELEHALSTAGGLAEIVAVLDGLDARLGRFDAPAAFDSSASMPLGDSAAYQQWLADVISRDLAEGVLGFARSPQKAALDILRELRDTVRYAVDFGGLTGESLDEFHRRMVPLMNRAVVGPQYERHQELLALLAAGIARAPFGPAPVVAWSNRTRRWTITSSQLRAAYSAPADWLVSAHVPLPAVESSASPLITALHRKGWIRRHAPASEYVHGIDVDRRQHPLDHRGRAIERIWALGPLCEGATFYNNLVPSPGVYSRPVFDAHRCVAEMFASARAAGLRAADGDQRHDGQPVAAEAPAGHVADQRLG